MVNVQQRTLRAFQQHPLLLFQQVLYHLFSGTNHRPQLLAPLAAKFQHFVGVNRRAAVHPGDDAVFHRYGSQNAVGQLLRGIQQVAHPDAVARDFVNVGGADALSGGADGGVAPGLLLQLVQQDVVGHDDVGAVADKEPAGVDAPLLQARNLPQQHVGVHHHAVADDAGDAGPADARWNQVELELAALVDYGMPGVVAAGVTHHAIGLSGEVIDYLALALVTPLSPDYGVSRHCALLPDAQKLTRKSPPQTGGCGGTCP